MIVFSVRTDKNQCSMGLVYETSEGKYFSRFRGISPSDWNPVTVELHCDEQSDLRDFISIGGALGCNNRACDLLTRSFPDEVEFLPVICKNDLIDTNNQFFLIKILNQVDCLDTTLSDLEYFPSGNVERITRHVFKPECLVGHYIFQISQRQIYPTFGSDGFRDFIDRNELTGLKFTKLWEG